jgi:hypothetical protein
MNFLGECIGVELVDRGAGDKHQMVKVMVEDDENWFVQMTFSSFWLDEAITVLEQAREHLRRTGEKEEFGWRRK